MDKSQLGCLFLVVCAFILLGASAVLIAGPKPMSHDEARQVIDEGKRAVNEGRGAPLTVLVPEDIRECAYTGECYSWGGKPKLWHKTCGVPILILVGVCTLVYTFAKINR